MAIKKLSSQQLRQHKGVSFPGVTTVFMCHDGNGKLLLAKRGPKARDENGRWDAGGGGLKHGQTLEENLRREVLEEYGTIPKQIDFIGYLDVLRRSPSGQKTHWLAMIFAVLVDPTQVRNNEPGTIDEIGWFNLDDLPSPLHSQYDNLLAKHGATLKKYMDIKPAN